MLLEMRDVEPKFKIRTMIHFGMLNQPNEVYCLECQSSKLVHELLDVDETRPVEDI